MGVVRNGFLILSTVGLLACSGKRLHAGDDGADGGSAGSGGSQAGSGGHAGSAGGQAGSAAGVAGSTLPSGTGGTTAGGAGGNGAGGSTGAAGNATGGSTGTGGTGGSGGAIGTGGTGGQGGATGSLRLLAGGLGGPGNVDGIGADARFFQPTGIVSDGTGNLFVSEYTGIRRIVLATGAVTTVSTQVDGWGVATDGAGNVYFASNYTIQKVVLATGAVTTLAGTPGSRGNADGTGPNASFGGPAGMVADRAGNLYVTDRVVYDFYNTILVRKVVISTGEVTTLANMQGRYLESSHGSVAIDGAGNLYLAYTGVISKVDTATGALSILPGTNTGFSDLLSIAGDGGGNLYVADSNNVRKIVIATGAVTTIADATGAALQFDPLLGIACGENGNLYVSDNSTIRNVDIATGAVTVVAGAARQQPGSANGTGANARFNSPYAVASDGAGNLYVADSDNATIRKIVIATGTVTTFAGTAGLVGPSDGTGTDARFYGPLGIASDGAGNLYVTDATIRKIVIATAEVTTLTTGPGHDILESPPFGIASDGAGNLYFDWGGSTIWKVAISDAALTKIAGTSGQYGSADGTGPAARFDGPSALAADGAGNLYVTDSRNATIRKIVLATNAVTTLAGLAGARGLADGTGAAARFDYPVGIASDGAGNLYVAEQGSVIRKIVIATATVSTVIGSPNRSGVSLGPLPASLTRPHGVAVLPSGELAITDSFENAVLIAHF